MRPSTLLTLTSAALVAASPIHKALHERAIAWDIVTDIVYVTVTEGNLPTTSTPDSTVVIKHTRTKWVNPPIATTSPKKVIPTTSSTPPPPPPPPATTSTTPPPPPPATSEAPLPVATTPPAAVFAASPTVEAEAVKPTTSAVVEAAPAPSPKAPSDYASTALFYHNAHRANHSASALTWSDSLAAAAAINADACDYGHQMGLNGLTYGQNIDSVGWSNEEQAAAWSPSKVLANSVTNDWYLPEVGKFDFESNQLVAGTGHFSQIVWKDTTTVGCATKYCGIKLDGGFYNWYTVCNYGPQGNIGGQYTKEVARSLGKAPATADGDSGVPHPWET